MNASQIKTLLKERGWSLTDVAARWGYSVTWMSRLVNDLGRSAHYNDAFFGLPKRESAHVIREARHIRKAKIKPVIPMYPVGRLVEADDNRYLDEGTRAVVIANTADQTKQNRGDGIVTLQVCATLDTFDLTMTEVSLGFCDLGIDDPAFTSRPTP